jgi:hypothetical protein
MKKIILLILALVVIIDYTEAQEFRINEENAHEFRINGEKISELDAQFIAINGSSKSLTRGGFNMTIDVGESNSIWSSTEITKDGESFSIKSPIFLINLFVENGYELVFCNTLTSGNNALVQYVLRKKD